MISDVKLPAEITIERDSCYALFGGRYGNVFCGLMSLPEGVIYVAPYTHDAARPAWTPQSVGGLTEYTHQANCAGRPIRKIYHQEGGIAGHEQLAIFLAEAGIVPAQGFVGFSILFSPGKGWLGNYLPVTEQSTLSRLDGIKKGPGQGFQEVSCGRASEAGGSARSANFS
jgi:hypothetical protein